MRVQRGNAMRKARSARPSDPTPAEIRELTESIQADWSDRERAKRAGAMPDAPSFALEPLTIPLVESRFILGVR